jgi:hypothetical protein
MLLCRWPLTLQIPYTNPDCSEYGNVRTKLIKYSTLVTLLSVNFDDPEGYYIVWDRCCRNDVISNIINPGRTSSLFYTEFPAISANNRSSLIQHQNSKTYQVTIFVSIDRLILILALQMQTVTV